MKKLSATHGGGGVVGSVEKRMLGSKKGGIVARVPEKNPYKKGLRRNSTGADLGKEMGKGGPGGVWGEVGLPGEGMTLGEESSR